MTLNFVINVVTLFRWSITGQFPLYCGCHRRTSTGTVFLIFLQSYMCY